MGEMVRQVPRMVRLSDLDDDFAHHLRELPFPTFTTEPWAEAPPPERARVAIISTAGLHRRTDPVFAPGASDYRGSFQVMWHRKTL